ncbi:MAG TPA: amidohydrolase [Terriglobales bacterium]|nr:amidohydrolase [Terriglobales bacterium]
MKVRSAAVLLLLCSLSPFAAAQQTPKAPAAQPKATAQSPDVIADKKAAVAWIDQHSAELSKISDQVWAYAETALREVKSSRTLADYAEKQGFKVRRGVSGMPTAFVATYGEGKPVIGIMGEYDALPGVSQKAIPTKEPLQPGAPGHGCGHNLFGAASIGAATAIKQLIADGKLKGTIQFFGTPAEESVGGKIYMARDGVFKDVDVMLAWHPADENTADTESSQALVDFIVEFRGRTAHAAYDPWNARSALHAAEFFVNGVNGLREHVRPTVRMHYVIAKGGDVPNVIPEYSKVWMWVRDSKRTGVENVLARVRDIAKGAALMAGVQETFTIQGGDYEMNVNFTGERLIHANMTWLGPLQFTPEEQQFAKTIQQATGVEPVGLITTIKPFDEKPGEPRGGSTDVGDVSWVVPTLHTSITTAPKDAPWHAWPVVATGGMSIGHKGMLYAAKVLAITMVDLFEDPNMRQAIRAEFDNKVKGQPYKPYIPPGPPPVPPEIMAQFGGSAPKPQTDK